MQPIPTNNLGYLMQHIAGVMARQADLLLQEKLDMGLSQFKILMILQKHPNVQQRFIADGLGQTEASITRQARLLQDLKLVAIHPDPNDKRQHIVSLTDEGNTKADAAMKLLRSTLGPEYELMGTETFKQLIAGLNALHEIVCRQDRPGKGTTCGHLIDTASADITPDSLKAA